MSSSDRDRARRGGPDRQRWSGQRWSGPGWSGPGWSDEAGRPHQHGWGGDWHGRGWSGDSNARRDVRRDGDRIDSGSDRPQGDARRGDGQRKRVRIGDAERDRAVSLLSDHFVAGRLTQAEFEERSEVVTQARYADDLEPLFDDLPTTKELQVAQGPANPRRRPGPPPPIMMLAPFLMVGLVVSSIALTAPWLLWGMFWILLITGMSRRRHHYR